MRQKTALHGRITSTSQHFVKCCSTLPWHAHSAPRHRPPVPIALDPVSVPQTRAALVDTAALTGLHFVQWQCCMISRPFTWHGIHTHTVAYMYTNMYKQHATVQEQYERTHSAWDAQHHQKGRRLDGHHRKNRLGTCFETASLYSWPLMFMSHCVDGFSP